MAQIWGGGSKGWAYRTEVTASGELVVTTGSGANVLPGTITTLPFGMAQLVGASGDGTTSWTYFMDATPGTDWSGATWRISRRGSVAASGLTVTEWASGNSNFDKRAVIYALYPYS